MGGAIRLWRDQLKASQSNGNSQADSNSNNSSSISIAKKAKVEEEKNIVDDLEKDFDDSDSDDDIPQWKKDQIKKLEEGKKLELQNSCAVEEVSLVSMPRGGWVLSEDLDLGAIEDLALMERLDSRGRSSQQSSVAAAINDKRAIKNEDDSGSDSDDSVKGALRKRKLNKFSLKDDRDEDGEDDD